MSAFFLSLALISALAIPWALLAAGGWPAAVGLILGFAAFGADPTDPLRAALIAAAVFAALSFLRRA